MLYQLKKCSRTRERDRFFLCLGNYPEWWVKISSFWQIADDLSRTEPHTKLIDGRQFVVSM